MSNYRQVMTLALGLGLGLTAFACDKNDKPESVNADEAAPAEGDAAAGDASAAAPEFADLDAALAGEHRGDNAARDAHRHPKETLEFFGIERNMTVAELWPGGGWYTEILGPYLRDEGKLIVTNWPTDHERYGKYAQRFADKVAAAPEIFGDLTIATAPVSADEAFELAAEGSVDVVVTFRNSHGWHNNGQTAQIYGAAFKALKPGGIFGVVQHRANEGANADETSKQGYLPQATVIENAKAAGFELVEASEINANPKDTKDYPGGVWTLPPNLNGPERDVEQSDEDKAKHTEIGESDRMTLKFRKPA